MPEAVDRLELVADREDLGELRVRDEVDQLALQPVRVLELVDHDHAEPQLRRLADRRRRRAGGRARRAGDPRSRPPTRAAWRRRTRRANRSSSSCSRSRSCAASSSSAASSASLRADSNAAARTPRVANALRSTSFSGSEPAVATRSASPALRRCVSVADGSAASSSASARSRRRPRRRRSARSPSSSTSGRPAERSVS